MASAYWNAKDEQWVADFRPVGGKDKQRRRVRLDLAKFKTEQQAKAYAFECERYCRLIDSGEHDQRDIAHAERIGAITEEQAAKLRDDLPAGSAHREVGPLTLKAAAAMHPTTKLEEEQDAERVKRYFAHLEDFSQHSGVRSVFNVTVDHVTAYIAHLKAEGHSWDGRRHRLLYLRRACRMAQTQGLPDPIAGLKLDKRPLDAPPVPVYTLAKLGELLRAEEDPRVRLVIGLGAFMGLRPSEIIRAYPEDLHGDTLKVGSRKAKNRASKRALAVPPTVAKWWRELAAEAKKGEPLLQTRHKGGGQPFDETTFSQWLAGHEPPIAAKRLRKSFATWAQRVIPPRDLERYMGHKTAFLAEVTSSHYIGEAAAAELRPSAAKIEKELAKLMKRRGKRLLREVATKSQAV